MPDPRPPVDHHQMIALGFVLQTPPEEEGLDPDRSEIGDSDTFLAPGSFRCARCKKSDRGCYFVAFTMEAGNPNYFGCQACVRCKGLRVTCDKSSYRKHGYYVINDDEVLELFVKDTVTSKGKGKAKDKDKADPPSTGALGSQSLDHLAFADDHATSSWYGRQPLPPRVVASRGNGYDASEAFHVQGFSYTGVSASGAEQYPTNVYGPYPNHSYGGPWPWPAPLSANNSRPTKRPRPIVPNPSPTSDEDKRQRLSLSIANDQAWKHPSILVMRRALTTVMNDTGISQWEAELILRTLGPA